MAHVSTPDRRYIVHIGNLGPRLWRASDPALSRERREALTKELMSARRGVRDAKGDPALLAIARRKVQHAKEQLGERGPVWWSDGQPDFNRKLVRNTPYQAWWATLNR